MSGGFTINKAYAERYNKWRQKEELQKLKDRYGDDVEASDSGSSSETEDEDAEELTEQLEKDWFRTLAALKSKDPKIYQKDVTFYHDQGETSSTPETAEGKKEKKNKPMFLKDVQRKYILEKEGKSSGDSELEEEPMSLQGQLTYSQEQEKIRKSLTAAIHSGTDSSDDEILTRRDKSREEKEKEDADFLEWMKGQKKNIKEKEVGVELNPLKDYWSKPDLDEGERFLRNYFLNQEYKEKDGESFPSYNEIVEEEEDFSEEEDLLEKQDDFERKYNFRFEEPDAQEIKTFPRAMADSVRRKDTKRAEKRNETKDRKKREKEKKKEELKQLKNMKRQEILDQIEKLKAITGNETLGFTEADLEEDFDPQKHDELMQKCFSEDYYEECDEETKPEITISDDALQQGTWDTWTGEEGAREEDEEWEGGHQEPDVEDPDFIMDCDYDPQEAAERKQKRKDKKGKKSRLSEALAKEKPVFDPGDKTFEEYLDEYYGLDYEDIVGDLPVRFRYRKCQPNNFGLSVDEILTAEERDLNAWVSLKKMSQYRTEDEEQADVRIFSKRGQNELKKLRVMPSLFKKNEEEEETTIKENKKQMKDKQKGQKNVTIQQNGQQQQTREKVKTEKTKSEKRELDVDDTSEAPAPKHLKKDTDIKSDIKPKLDGTDKTDKKRKKKRNKKKPGSSLGEGSANEAQSRKTTPAVTSGSDSQVVKQTPAGWRVTEIPSGAKVAEPDDKLAQKLKKKLKRKEKKQQEKRKLSDERLKAYGINPRKYKFMTKEDLTLDQKTS